MEMYNKIQKLKKENAINKNKNNFLKKKSPF